MDKSWITKPRNTMEYSIGLEKFLDFAFEHGATENRIRCPCPKCGFRIWKARDVVLDHLICKPFPENYVIWDFHGEKQVATSSRSMDGMQEMLPTRNPLETMVDDAFGIYSDQGNDESVSRQQASTESSNPSVDSKRYVGRESTRYWNVQTIDSENATKKKNITVKEVNNLPRGERIIVEFDREGAAYGEAQGVLAGYCGILASDSNLFPISFEKWSGKLGMPNTYKKECFQTMIKSRFFFRTSEKEAYKYCNASLSKKWVTNRYRIWNEFYNPAETRDQLISNVPTGIQRDQWAAFVTYRLKPSTVELCQKNKESRSKQTIPHTCGSKSNSRRRHELFLEIGKYPSRRRIYIDTHKRKNGSFVNDEARDTVEQIELNMAQSNADDESEISPNDDVGKVFGTEHSRRVRCMGMGAIPSSTFRNGGSHLGDTACSSSTCINLQRKVTHLETQLHDTLNALKTYMLAKDGRIPDEFVGLFASQ